MAVIQERKTSDGKTKYRVLVRLKGHPPQSATFDRKSDAKKWAQDTEFNIRHNRHFKTTESKKHTVADMIDRYTEQVLPNKPKNAQSVSCHLSWWKDQLGHYSLADVSTAMIAGCRDTLLAEKTHKGTLRSPATVVRYMTSFSQVLNLAAKEWEWLEINPASNVKKPTEPRGRVRFLDDDERERLLKACKETESPLLYPVVVLALSTGMRHGELMNIQWKDVDFERRRILLHETKNGERRAVPLVRLAHDQLKGLAKVPRLDNPYIFPSRDSKKPASIRTAWDSALKKAKIEDFRFHDLRHTAASYLAMNGATLAEIAEVLGHKTLQMVKRYAHLSEAHTTSVVDRMNEKIFG